MDCFIVSFIFLLSGSKRLDARWQRGVVELSLCNNIDTRKNGGPAEVSSPGTTIEKKKVELKR